MLTGIHILLTYQCNFECDHCFLYSSPHSQGTLTSAQIRSVLEESRRIGTVEWIYFEGGEPFLYYPAMLEGIRLVKGMGFKVGIVTNGYGAISMDDADLWLQPLARLGVDFLSISDDAFHYGDDEETPAKRASAAAGKLGIASSPICIEQPYMEANPGQGQDRGKPVIGGGAMFKGRAVEKLIGGLPRRPWQELSRCPYEDLRSPSRVHVDAYGHIHICQGLSLGNMWQQPLSKLVREYNVDSHPVCGPLDKGGPALLSQTYGFAPERGYVDECHFCYLVRRALIRKFPEYIAPKQVYGL